MSPSGDSNTAADQSSAVFDERRLEARADELFGADGVELTVDGDHAGERIVGDVDLVNRDHVVELGGAAIASPHVEDLVVDVSGATFCAAAGVGALVQLREDAAAADKRLALRGVPPPVSKVLTITNLDAAFGLTNVDETGRC